ncbi:hypothetical protein FXB39_02450 [Nocardioides sp. BGMRC 2183]|nr:hypothetical protein FXB39_02450 [Nocardioides sp. BGMRC 2183]
MAVVHPATITPTKPEVLSAWLGGQVEVLGTYRYDDPAGEVGVEAFVVHRGDELLHVVLTYRGAPIDGATQVATMEHSVLGARWVYDGTTDPVALGCYARALRGEQEQAAVEIWQDGEVVEVREPTATVSREPGTGSSLAIVGELAAVEPSDGARLIATWNRGSAVVARLI